MNTSKRASEGCTNKRRAVQGAKRSRVLDGHDPVRSARVAIVLMALAVLGLYGTAEAQQALKEKTALTRVDRSEELTLKLTKELKVLNTSILNLHLPDGFSYHLFGDTVAVTDLAIPAQASPSTARLAETPAQVRDWPIDDTVRSGAPQDVPLWRPFLDGVHFFKHAEFHIVRGRFLNEAETRYETDLHFNGVAWMASEQYVAVEAKLKVVWGKYASWRIDEWWTLEFRVMEAPRPLFTEVLDQVISSPDELQRARTSLHEQYLVRLFRDRNFKKPHKYFQIMSADLHPGLAVVDIDRDGFDDVYVMARWGPNMLFRNRGDGTFEEIAARLGLDIADHTSSALFADFDNDGDLDVFLGRTLERSMYLTNENGRFVDRSETLIGTPLPYFVSSISAADYNGDGLLDVYFSTYAASTMIEMVSEEDRAARIKKTGKLLAEFLPDDQAKELYQKSVSEDWHAIRNFYGPPNVLLKNLGNGRFDVAPNAEPLEVWRHTFQATWADFDDDGDPDVYIANDYSLNNLIRNDGNGQFVDVTDETGTADLGFGMGVSWGDYDNDGRQDLYVTNMYSKAGRRITAETGAVGARFTRMARGNTLFRNVADRFDMVSGLEPPALMVEKAGWGWGSQFVDINNDGYLDIYALSGFYTAPRQVRIPEDT